MPTNKKKKKKIDDAVVKKKEEKKPEPPKNWLSEMPQQDFRDYEAIVKSIVCLAYLFLIMKLFRMRQEDDEAVDMNRIEAKDMKASSTIVAKLPLLDSREVQRGRYQGGDDTNSSIKLHEVRITDLASLKKYNHSVSESGFEVGRLAPFIELPSEEEYQTLPPAMPFQDEPRPLRKYVDQFHFNSNSIKLPNHFAFFFKCSGELLRGASANGAATSGSARHPPTFNTHVDQDMNGSPLDTVYWGILPYLFDNSKLDLYNVWIPLNNETVRPLALMDKRKVKQGDVAKWSETTFGIDSDRFIVTDKAKNRPRAWFYKSDMGVGDAYVFKTGSVPHTSFAHPNAGEGVRYSLEMRCAGVMYERGAFAFGIVGTTTTVAYYFFVGLLGYNLLKMFRRKYLLKSKKAELAEAKRKLAEGEAKLKALIAERDEARKEHAESKRVYARAVEKEKELLKAEDDLKKAQEKYVSEIIRQKIEDVGEIIRQKVE